MDDPFLEFRNDTDVIIASLKSLFEEISQKLVAKFFAAFETNLSPQLEFLKNAYTEEYAEERFMKDCFEFLNDANSRVDILTDAALRELTPGPINWRHAEDIRYVMLDTKYRSSFGTRPTLRLLVRWKGTESYVDVRPGQCYEEDEVLQQRLRVELNYLERGLFTEDDGRHYDWRTESTYDRPSPSSPHTPVYFTIERDFYQHSYLLNRNNRGMQLVNIDVILGTEQLQKFMSNKAYLIRNLMRSTPTLVPLNTRICTICENIATTYAICCNETYCSKECQTKAWSGHKSVCISAK